METTTVKVTVAQKFDKVIEFLVENDADSSLVEFIKDRKEKNAKKSTSKSKKPSSITEEKLNMVMEQVTAPILSKEVGKRLDWSPQRLSSVVSQLIKLKQLEKAKTKEGLMLYPYGTLEAETAEE